MAVRAEAAALLALTLVLAGILPAARPTGRTSRALPQVLGAIPVAAVALGIVTASGLPQPLVLILLLGCVITVLLLARGRPVVPQFRVPLTGPGWSRCGVVPRTIPEGGSGVLAGRQPGWPGAPRTP
jgi:hypothetical protein